MTWDELLGLAPFDPDRNKPVALPGGSYATEYSATTQLPDGQYIVHPQIWWDQQGNPRWLGDEWGQRAAMLYEQQSGNPFPRFASPQEADAWAANRSHNGGGTQGQMNSAKPGLLAMMATRPRARP